MSKILGVISPIGLGGGGHNRADDDFMDRLHHSYTVIVLVVFAIIVSTKQYVGDPIQCWAPAYFSSNYIDYTNKICWVSNTYYKPVDEAMPESAAVRPDPDRQEVVYYQWVPLILLTQALFFYLPNAFWSILNSRSGIDINSMVEAARTMHDSENHEKTLRYIVKQMDRFCASFRPTSAGRCGAFKKFFLERCLVACGKKHGTFLLAMYLLTKMLYVANALTQFFFLDMFMGTDYHMYGFQVLQSLLAGHDWVGAKHFPRVTLCDFKVRQLGNIHPYTVQCVLPINLFNEKIFIFVWFWFVMLCALSVISMTIWLGRTFFRVDHVRFVKRYLKSFDKFKGQDDKKRLRRFVHEYLRPDGVLTLRIISVNANELVVAEITSELWEYYKNNPPSWHRDEEEDIQDV